jgi:hypothetical protein
MITQQLIDEWTRHAPAAGLERDLIIAQRAAQLALGKEPKSLVMRVSQAMELLAGDSPMTYEPEARVALRTIAADARARDFNGKSRLISWEGVANWLEREAQQ